MTVRAEPREASITSQAVILFSGADAACDLVAGLPAAARSVHAAAQAGLARCWVLVRGAQAPDALTRAEAQRLAGDMQLGWLGTEAELERLPDEPALFIPGEWLVRAEEIGAVLAAGVGAGQVHGMRLAASSHHAGMLDLIGKPEEAESYSAQTRQIIAATAKPGDGIVSRHINRPISQAISRLLLTWPGIRPIHGTWGTAAIAVVMAAALLTGTQAGLILGAVLFQVASMFDGVDGEIARATFRTSPQGAKLDSLIDAATNIACLGGVAINLHLRGESQAALAGAGGILLLAIGLTVIGRRTRSARDGMTFNAVKDHFAARPSRLMQWLTWLTMRDFFALAGAILVVAGFAVQTMYALLVVATGWLVVVLAVMMRQSA